MLISEVRGLLCFCNAYSGFCFLDWILLCTLSYLPPQPPPLPPPRQGDLIGPIVQKAAYEWRNDIMVSRSLREEITERKPVAGCLTELSLGTPPRPPSPSLLYSEESPPPTPCLCVFKGKQGRCLSWGSFQQFECLAQSLDVVMVLLRYLLCVISLLGNTEDRRNNRVGKKAPLQNSRPHGSFPSFQDCDLNFIQLCPFSHSFLVPKGLELGTVAASAP